MEEIDSHKCIARMWNKGCGGQCAQKRKFGDFCKKHKTLVNDLLSYSQIISPSEIKDTLYIITKYYPDMVLNIYPWYLYDDITNTWTLHLDKCTQIIESYEHYNRKNTYVKCLKYIFCCKCCLEKKNNYNGLLQQYETNI